MPAQQGSWIATAYLETGTIAKGQVACLNEAGTRYVVASDANRTAAGRRSACIAITAGDADDPGGSSFEAQYVGAVPPEISGLGDGTESLIRVSDAGVLERVAEYSTSDDVCGHCDADGTAYVCFPLVGLGAALGASSAPGLPARSIQYYLDANTLGGATHAGISSDGYIEHSADRTGGAATVGDDRFAKACSAYARNSAGSGDLCIWRHLTGSVDGLFLGYDPLGSADPTAGAANGWPTVTFGAAKAVAMQVGFVSSGYAAGLVAFGPGVTGATGSGATARFGFSHPNFALAPRTLIASLSADPFNGGRGYLWIEDVANVRGGVLRTTGFGLWSDSTTHHPMVTIGGTDYDLLSSSVNYRKDVVGAGASLGYIDLTVSGKDATTLNINLTSGSGDCDGFAHDLVDPQTMVLTVIITLNGGGAEGGGSGTFTFNALAGATAAYMIRDFDGSSNDIVIGINSVIQFVWDGNGWRLISSVAL